MDIKQNIKEIIPELIEIRHELHRNPQGGFTETFAAEIIENFLAKRGVNFQAGLAETGVVAWLLPEDESLADKPAIALRADIDALQIQETSGLDYASRNPGWMHACGHDGHTAMLLGAIDVLNANRALLTRPVKFIFQPAEENLGGAVPMIEQGCLDSRTGGVEVERIFALHNWPALPAGTIATRPGAFFASVDGFKLNVTGVGGHGACPEFTRDVVLAGAHIVTALQSIKSRNLPANESAVVSVCAFNAGKSSNIIPDSAELMGTIRAYDDSMADYIKRRISDIAASTAHAFGCECKYEQIYNYPVLVNDSGFTWAVAEVAGGVAEVDSSAQPVTVGEDFAYYAQKIPACFCLLGGGSERTLHNSEFDFNDEIIPVGVELLCRVAMMSYTNSIK